MIKELSRSERSRNMGDVGSAKSIEYIYLFDPPILWVKRHGVYLFGTETDIFLAKNNRK